MGRVDKRMIDFLMWFVGCFVIGVWLASVHKWYRDEEEKKKRRR
jgi:hypothetical protein